MTATVTALTSAARSEVGGWTARRHEVIARDAGRCALCGLPSADTAYHAWEADDLVAAHTRCVVGLGPPERLRAAA